MKLDKNFIQLLHENEYTQAVIWIVIPSLAFYISLMVSEAIQYCVDALLTLNAGTQCHASIVEMIVSFLIVFIFNATVITFYRVHTEWLNEEL